MNASEMPAAAKPVISDCAVIALDISVLLWVAGLDKHQADTVKAYEICTY